MTRRVTVLLACTALLAAACGQFPGTHQRGVQLGEAPAAGTGVTGGTGVGGAAGAGGGLNGTTTGTGGTGGTGTTTAGGTTGGTSGSTGSEVGGGTGGPADTTGVTANNINIGIHAPITGAAPVADNSFITGKDLYWKYGANGGPVKIFGRTVTAEVQNDNYNPSTAVQRCNEMAGRDFLIVGGAGTDQIAACEQQVAAPKGIPYLSAGVTQAQLQQYGQYFALSMSYPQQMPLLVQYIEHKLGISCGSNVKIIATNTSNFDDAFAAFKQQCPNAAYSRPDKSDSTAVTEGQSLCDGPQPKYDVVVPLVAPLFFLEMAGSQGAASLCKPKFAGVGITMGIDAVAEQACNFGYATDSMHFFSPVTSYSGAGATGQNDKAFQAALDKAHTDGDDIMWILWNLSKTLAALLNHAGQNLSRQQFISATSTATVSGAGFPALHYTPSNHFGAHTVNVLKLVCSGSGHWETQYTNQGSF